MKPYTLKRFFREERAAVAATTAIFLLMLLIALGVVIDLGQIIVVKVELQNAADAGAMAGAEALYNPAFHVNAKPRPYNPNSTPPWMRGRPTWARTPGAFINDAGLPILLAQVVTPIPPPTFCDIARAAAQSAVATNKAGGKQLTLPDSDVQLGQYNFNPALQQWKFVAAPCSNNTNAVEVVTRRTNAVNGPVQVFFAKVLGRDSVELSAQAIAMLGWVKGVGKGRGTFPIALGDQYVPPPGGRLFVTFNPNGSDTGAWHTFFDPSASASDLQKLVDGITPSPEIKCGDYISMTNGVASSVVSDMKTQFNNVHHGNWTVVLPVITASSNYVQTRKVIGFCAFQITEVKGPPDKTVSGYALGGYILPNSDPGGNMGLRTSLPKLVN
jgi:hypothetical protein